MQMQFSYNSDYPGLTAATAASPSSFPQTQSIAKDPEEFPTAEPIPCARITTRVFHPTRNQVATVQNVLIRTRNSPVVVGSPGNNGSSKIFGESDSLNSNMSSVSSSSSDSMTLDADSDDDINSIPSACLPQNDANEVKHAYWIQRTIREAIYGRVLFAVILKKRPRSLVLSDGAEWEVTSEHCAVKEMSWEHIRRHRNRLAEDPIKEVASMQYLNRCWRQAQQSKTQQQQQQYQQSQQQQSHQFHFNQQFAPPVKRQETQQSNNYHANVDQSFFAMRDTNIMMPLDLLSDERNLYSIMPYCDGGELFERLDLNERFSEEEARYWMDHVLNVSSKSIS